MGININFCLATAFDRPFLRSPDGSAIVKMELSTAVLLDKTGAGKPFHSYRKRERVALEKIPAAQTFGDIKQGILNLIEKLGGIRRFVKPGQTVAIKPNIVSDHGLKDGKVTGGIVTDILSSRRLRKYFSASPLMCHYGRIIHKPQRNRQNVCALWLR